MRKVGKVGEDALWVTRGLPGFVEESAGVAWGRQADRGGAFREMVRRVSRSRKNSLAPLAIPGNSHPAILVFMSYRFYSSQRPEGKVQVSDLERLGESSEASLRVSCRQRSCFSRLHHYLHHCPGCFTFDVSISCQKILFFVDMLSFGLPQVECEF